MDDSNYTLIALRGIQAGCEYFVAMCPLRLLPRIFLFNEIELPPELRSQRLLNRARLPAMIRYLVDQPHGYIFSAITASIDGEIEFLPLSNMHLERNIGQLIVPKSARFVVNDGQHRRAAIEGALKERPELGDETIAVVFFIDAGLKRSQQFFADLNTHAVRASASLGILYDFHDPLAHVARTVANDVPIFQQYTDLERSTISNRSVKLWTLSGIYYATAALLRKTRKDTVAASESALAVAFWIALSEIIPEWNKRVISQTTAADLRRQYVHMHSVTLHALGLAGADLLATHPDHWRDHIQPLATLDWSRSNTVLWEGRALIGGQMSKARTNVTRTASAIKQALGLPLSPDEVRLENAVHS